MASRKGSNTMAEAAVGAVGQALLGVAARALGSAVESVLEDISGGLKTVDEKVSKTKSKVSGARKRKPKTVAVEAEVVDDDARKH